MDSLLIFINNLLSCEKFVSKIMWRRNFFSIIVILYIIGTTLSTHFPWKALTLLLFSQFFLCIFLAIKSKNDILLYFVAICISLSSGLIITKFQDRFKFQEEHSILAQGITSNIKGEIEDISYTKKGLLSLTIKVKKEKCILYIKGDADITNNNIGDSLEVEARTSAIKNFTSEFDYKKYMHQKGIFSSAFIDLARSPSLKIIPQQDKQLKYILKQGRTTFNEFIENNMGLRSKENIAIVAAFTTGEKGDISPEQKLHFQASGAMHILALSGLHIGIIYKIISFILSFLGNYTVARRIKSISTVSLLWTFAVFTGMGISIVRAVLMATIYEIIPKNQGSNKTLSALALSALVILTKNPMATNSLSFQLSFAAMLGISTIYPTLSRMPQLFVYKSKILKSVILGIRDILLISISCQITTAPIIYFTFNTYTDLYLLTNLLVMPLTTIIIALIVISLPLTFFLNKPTFINSVLDHTLNLLNYIIETISTMK